MSDPLDVTLVVPVERGRPCEARLPEDVTRSVVEHEPGRRGEVLDQAVRDARTTFVFVVEPDAGINRSSLEALVRCAWDAAAVYPTVVCCDNDFEVREVRSAQPYCPHRLKIANYVGPGALVRREVWHACGGWGAGPWSLWLRLPRLKPCREARYWLRELPEPGSPPVTEPLLAASFYAQASPAQTYWRCQVPGRQLPASVQSGLPRLAAGKRTARFPEHRGAAIFVAPGDGARAAVMTMLREQGVPVLVDVDDDYLRHADVHGRAGWSERAFDVRRPHSTEQHRWIAASADAVIVASETLAKRYRRVNSDVFVCPNAVEPADWPALEKQADGILRVGWFGSSSHAGDLPLVGPGLEWASSQAGVEVVLMGVGETNGRPSFPFPHRHVPFDYDIGRYWSELARLDIALAPIVPTHWSVCRSDLKALEYAMAGACPVLSDEPPYAGWAHEQGCLKARTSEEFLAAVKRLVGAPDEARALAGNARRYVLEERTIGATLWRWHEALDAATQPGAGDETRDAGG